VADRALCGGEPRPHPIDLLFEAIVLIRAEQGFA